MAGSDVSRHTIIPDFKDGFDYTILNQQIDSLLLGPRKHNFTHGYLGTTILGRKIPYLKLGNGKKITLYVGCHHGMEWMTSMILMRFASEYIYLASENRRIYNLSAEYLWRNRSVYIIPMLNPDGAELSIHGLTQDNPLKERLLAMNNHSSDFKHWQANARGVDLNHNYDHGFEEYKQIEKDLNITGGCATRYSGEYPESESETASLCAFIREHEKDITMLISFHTQGEEIYWSNGSVYPPRALTCAKILSKLSGYTLGEADGPASYGGLKDWYIQQYNRPAFTLECGKGQNPLPISDFAAVYEKLRELLFTAIIL